MQLLHRVVARVLALLVLLAAAAVPAQQGNTIRLGQTLPLSGPLTELGTEYRDGAQTYFADQQQGRRTVARWSC